MQRPMNGVPAEPPAVNPYLAMQCIRVVAEACINHAREVAAAAKQEGRELAEGETDLTIEFEDPPNGMLLFKLAPDGKTISFRFLAEKDRPRIIIPGAH